MKTPRFAIQFADGTLARNATGVRTSKTRDLAQKHIDDTIRHSAKMNRARLIRQNYSETTADMLMLEAARTIEQYSKATVVER